jgi:type IV pilus assembly protein PilM
MANPRFAWGIDIGNRALKAIKLVRDGDSLRMDDVEVIEHEQVLSNSGDNRETLIQTALANFAQRHLTKGGVVAVGVSGQSSFARFIKLPPVEKNKIPEIVRFEAIQQIPFSLDQVEWSYQLFQQPDSPDIEVGIFAMRKELVNQQIKYFTDMEMNVQVVQMSPLAVYNAMFYDNRLADGTTMVLDLGAENADLIIADGESVWLRSVPIGGNNFTEALVKAFKLNFSKAEELKRNAQTSKYARQIFQAMRPIFADLVAEIQRSIGFYSSVHRDSRIKRIIALGNTFRLPTLQKYLQQNLQIDVERLDTFTAGQPNDGRLAAMLSDNIASMAGAYGLALQAMGQGKIGSSLLPMEIRRGKIWQEKTKWFGLAAAGFVAAAGVMYGSYYFHNDKFEANQGVRGQIDQVISRAEKFDQEWAEIETSGGADKQRIRNVNALQHYRDAWANLWYDLTSTLPPETDTVPDKIKATPRAQRKQVFIDWVNPQFQPDITTYVNMDSEQFKGYAATTPPKASSDNLSAGGSNYTPGVRGGGNYGRGGEDTLTRGGGGFTRGGFERTTPQIAPSTGEPPLDGTTPPATDRGFLVTVQCTSPFKDASALVDSTLVKQLTEKLALEPALKDKKNYYVARAMIVSASQINANETRKAAFKAIYDRRKADQEKMIQLLQPVSPTGGETGPGGRTPTRGGIRGSVGGRGAVRGGDFSRGGAASPVTPLPGGSFDSTDPAKEEAEAYLDPLFQGESVLEDWELTVLVAVVLDPKKPEPVPTPEGTTPEGINPDGTPVTPAPTEGAEPPSNVSNDPPTDTAASATAANR